MGNTVGKSTCRRLLRTCEDSLRTTT